MGRGPKTVSQALLTFDFRGAGLPYGATPALGMVGLPLTWEDPTFQADLRQGAIDLVQLTCTTTVTLTELRIKVGPEDSGPTHVITVGEPGAEGASQLPPSVAMLIRKVVPNTTTRRMGRLFWPGLSEGNVDAAGVLDPGALADYQTAWAGFLDVLLDHTVSPAVFDETSDPREVTALTVQSRVATQRDRLRR